MRIRLFTIISFGCFLGRVATGQEPAEPPAIRIRCNHTDQQLEELLDLFKGTRAAHPAAALAAWKRASRKPDQLGKPLEALIAAFNPLMVRELKALEGGEVTIRFDPGSGRPEWSAVLPSDDGTFSALATAFVLSGGEAEAPHDQVAIDRLAGPGSPLIARLPAGTVITSNRQTLQSLIDRPKLMANVPVERLKAEPGVQLRLDPDALQGSKSLLIKRLALLLRPAKPHPRAASIATEGLLSLDRGRFSARLYSFDLFSSLPPLSVHQTWSDWVPRDRVIASFALATDPSAESWKSVFGLADRIEKVDPTMSNVAPVSLRLNLFVQLLGLRLETDLLHHLQGISGWVGTDGLAINTGAILLHLDDHAAAERIVSSMKPFPGSGPRPADDLNTSRWLGRLEGQPLRIGRAERTVILGWGDGSIEASLRARQIPDTSAGLRIRELTEEKGTLFCGLVWPGRLPRLAKPGDPRQGKIEEIDPIVARVVPSERVMSIVWRGSRDFLKRFLDALPLDPPPDR